MTVNFKSLLDAPIIEKAVLPPNLPNGTYKGTIVKWEPGESAIQKTAFLRFHVQITEACEDVLASNPEVSDMNMNTHRLKRDFYFPDDPDKAKKAAFYREQFLSSIDVDFLGKSYNVICSECIGKDVLCSVVDKPNSQDSTKQGFNEIIDMKGIPED